MTTVFVVTYEDSDGDFDLFDVFATLEVARAHVEKEATAVIADNSEPDDGPGVAPWFTEAGQGTWIVDIRLNDDTGDTSSDWPEVWTISQRVVLEHPPGIPDAADEISL